VADWFGGPMVRWPTGSVGQWFGDPLVGGPMVWWPTGSVGQWFSDPLVRTAGNKLNSEQSLTASYLITFSYFSKQSIKAT